MTRLKVNIKSDHAAFEDRDSSRAETARILRDLADRIEGGDGFFILRDVNGNEAGRATYKFTEN